MNPAFELHPQLARDTFVLADLELSRLLLLNDSHYPWCLLVPRVPNVREIYELDPAQRGMLLNESVALGQAMMRAFGGDKLNVAALGNVVPQLHVHHIVRSRTDAAWPAPVWGKHPAQPYDEIQRRAFVERLAPHLAGGQLRP